MFVDEKSSSGSGMQQHLSVYASIFRVWAKSKNQKPKLGYEMVCDVCCVCGGISGQLLSW